jgi:HD-like signal output (HDOD) protein
VATLKERFEHDVEKLTDLPAFSPVVSRLIATLGRDDTNVVEISEIIRQEPVLAARVLQSANSVCHAGRVPATTVHDALLRLGLATTRRLALLMSLRSLAWQSTLVVRTQFWLHSLSVAHGAAVIATHSRTRPESSDGEVLFLTGLLHDLGLLVLASHYPREHETAVELARREGLEFAQAERLTLGTDHGELGAILTMSWLLPVHICGPIDAHHHPDEAAAEHRWSARVLHLADRVSTVSGLGDINVPAPGPADWEAVGIPVDAVATVIAEVKATA